MSNKTNRLIAQANNTVHDLLVGEKEICIDNLSDILQKIHNDLSLIDAADLIKFQNEIDQLRKSLYQISQQLSKKQEDVKKQLLDINNQKEFATKYSNKSKISNDE